ncbi:MAG: hypothetical protein EOR45_35080, partial [Mesorhizobium sp.]
MSPGGEAIDGSRAVLAPTIGVLPPRQFAKGPAMAAKQRSKAPIPKHPLWITLPYTLFVAVLTPVYWLRYGPGNFLWFSDIALFAVLIALWTGSRLLYSMMAVGVLPLEFAWLADFVTGGKLTGLAAYM